MVMNPVESVKHHQLNKQVRESFKIIGKIRDSPLFGHAPLTNPGLNPQGNHPGRVTQ